MARIARRECESEVYHITARGAGRMNIFESDDDALEFESMLARALDDDDVELYAWCLMSNHVHLLLRGFLASISKVMQRALGAYASYFNAAHGHVGHVFQGRFHSVPVESDAQIIAAVRYVHLNPDAAGFGRYLDYEWSSYLDYSQQRKKECVLSTQTQFVLDIFGSRRALVESHEAMAKEMSEKPTIHRPASSRRGRNGMTEAMARAAAQEVAGDVRLEDLATLERGARDCILANLKSRGLSVRQIERLTGIGRGIIQRARQE